MRQQVVKPGTLRLWATFISIGAIIYLAEGGQIVS